MLSSTRGIGQFFMALFALALVFGCSKKPEGGATAGSASAKGQEPRAELVTLQGSGASFPAPLYSRWFKEFGAQQKEVRVDYQSVGSGAGVKAFLAKQTDFGASDAAMSDEEIQKAEGNVVLLPVTAGSIVLAYNLEGVEKLNLTREVYTGIFLGKITKWNDAAIAKENPDAKLPSLPISVVRRADGSGTTFVFTKHLSAISEAWSKGPGTGKAVDWPVGVGGKGNEGVTAQLKQTAGSIGYVEYGYASSSGLKMAALQNKAGKFVEANLANASATLASIDMPSDLRAWAADPQGEGSYPIVSYTWILAKKKYEEPAKAAAVKKTLQWALTDGQAFAEELGYIKLPAAVVTKVQAAVTTIQ